MRKELYLYVYSINPVGKVVPITAGIRYSADTINAPLPENVTVKCPTLSSCGNEVVIAFASTKKMQEPEYDIRISSRTLDSRGATRDIVGVEKENFADQKNINPNDLAAWLRVSAERTGAELYMDKVYIRTIRKSGA